MFDKLSKRVVYLVSFFWLINSFTYYSQTYVKQDKYLNENFFKNKRNGVFVDIGAYDGITHSNTYFFEKELEWHGICFEPLPEIFKILKNNRTSTCINGCASDANSTTKFIEVSGYPEMLSGLIETYDSRHLDRVKSEISKYGGSYKIVDIETFNITEMLLRHGITKVDYLSIDTEGSELKILKAIDFHQISIHIMTVENNYKDPSIKQYMLSKGFKFITLLGGQDEVYINPFF